MKKYLLFIVIILVIIAAGYYLYCGNRGGWRKTKPGLNIEQAGGGSLNQALTLLKQRKDNQARVIFEKILADEPDNLDALWGKAEVLRRSRDYQACEAILNRILNQNPEHFSSLISLAYIRYKDDKFPEALSLIKRVLKDCRDINNRALAYMLWGSINSRRAARGGLIAKIGCGMRIKCYFLKAKELAPDLPEVRLGLGTFCLLAPAIIGGNLDEAIKELEMAVKLAPDFATANARLAQAYKKEGLEDKYQFYLTRAKTLDPENEVLGVLR